MKLSLGKAAKGILEIGVGVVGGEEDGSSAPWTSCTPRPRTPP